VKSKTPLWFICSDGSKVHGPVSSTELVAELRSGQLLPQAWIQPANGTEADPEQWEYVFSYPELREVTPKPVAAKKSRAPREHAASSQQAPLFSESALSGLTAIIHNELTVFEASVRKIHNLNFLLTEMGHHSLKVGDRIFLHLYDQVQKKSATLWTELVQSGPDMLYLEGREVPPQAQTKLNQIIERFAHKKVA